MLGQLRSAQFRQCCRCVLPLLNLEDVSNIFDSSDVDNLAILVILAIFLRTYAFVCICTRNVRLLYQLITCLPSCACLTILRSSRRTQVVRAVKQCAITATFQGFGIITTSVTSPVSYVWFAPPKPFHDADSQIYSSCMKPRPPPNISSWTRAKRRF